MAHYDIKYENIITLHCRGNHYHYTCEQLIIPSIGLVNLVTFYFISLEDYSIHFEKCSKYLSICLEALYIFYGYSFTVLLRQYTL